MAKKQQKTQKPQEPSTKDYTTGVVLSLPSIEKFVQWVHKRFGDKKVRIDQLVLMGQSDGVVDARIDNKLLLEILKANVQYDSTGQYRSQKFENDLRLVWTGLAGWWQVTSPATAKNRDAMWDGDPDTFPEWFGKTFAKSAKKFDSVAEAAIHANPRAKGDVTEKQLRKLMNELVLEGVLRHQKSLDRYRLVIEEEDE